MKRAPIQRKGKTEDSGGGPYEYSVQNQSLEVKWKQLCGQYLPIIPKNSIWRYSRAIARNDPEQGWKIHVSATVLSANRVFERVAPLLSGLGVLFKAPSSLQELGRINSGLFYGFSQIGKFITVYPKTPDSAVSLAGQLKELTNRLPAPAVPYDFRFGSGSSIYYRYGAFSSLKIEMPDGTLMPAIRNPEGGLVPDLREAGAAAPAWAADPFRRLFRHRKKATADTSPLRSTVWAYEALSQRGKGGVYRAVDLSVTPARLCILKEGRRHGETDWDGRDGYWRVEREGRVLSLLAQAGVEVPGVYTTFELGTHHYLVTEFVEGDNLQSVLSSNKKIPIFEALRYGIQLAELLHRIHAAGWIWRDCKPLNLILTKKRLLRPVDFEGACSVAQPDKMPWGTVGYIPPEWMEYRTAGARITDDLFALGATLHQMLSGRVPDASYPPPPIGSLRRHVPYCARQVVSALLDPAPSSRPDAVIVARELESACLQARA